MDHVLDYPTTDLHAPSSLSAQRLHALRGPFTTTSDYLAHYLRACLFKMTEFPKETMDEMDGPVDGEGGTEEAAWKDKEMMLHDAERVVRKAIELCHIYPGEAAVYRADPAAAKHGSFTIRMEDFRLVNILVCDSTISLSSPSLRQITLTRNSRLTPTRGRSTDCSTSKPSPPRLSGGRPRSPTGSPTPTATWRRGTAARRRTSAACGTRSTPRWTGCAPNGSGRAGAARCSTGSWPISSWGPVCGRRRAERLGSMSGWRGRGGRRMRA